MKQKIKINNNNIKSNTSKGFYIEPRPIDNHTPRDGTRIMIFDAEKQLWGFGSWIPGEEIEEPFTHCMPSPEPPSD